MVMQIEKKKTVVGEMPCDSCRAEIDLKVNEKGGVYGVCTNIVRPEAKGNKKYCWHRVNFSTYAGEEIKANFLEEQAINAGQDQNKEETDGENAGSTTGEAGKGQFEIAGAVGGGSKGALRKDEPKAGSEKHRPDKRAGAIKSGIIHFLTADE